MNTQQQQFEFLCRDCWDKIENIECQYEEYQRLTQILNELIMLMTKKICDQGNQIIKKFKDFKNNITQYSIGQENGLKIQPQLQGENELSIQANKINSHQVIPQQNSKEQLKNWREIDQKQQIELCCSLVFNSNSSLLIIAEKEKIKLFKISDGKLDEESLILIGHRQIVTCLAYSKNNDLLYSGSEDCTIRVWRKSWIKQWNSKSYKQFNKGVLGVLIDEKSGQIISWGREHIIKISQQNQGDLKQIQVLEKHDVNSNVDCVCLNEQSNVLCSSGSDKQLIIWKKNQKMLQWQFSQTISKNYNDYIVRMCFIKETLVCAYWSEGIVQPFDLEDNTYVEISENKIQLNKQCDVENLFPCIYNQQQNLLMLKHNKNIYFLDNKLRECITPIECQDEYCYGTLSNNAKYLAVWDNTSKMVRIYENPLQQQQ